MTRSNLILVLAVLGVWLFATVFAAAMDRFYHPKALIDSQATLIQMTNRDRAPMAPLVEDSALDTAAQSRARYICSNGFSHDGWQGAFGRLPYTHIGENLARNYMNATFTERALMNSPEHKANILDPLYTDIGVAYLSCKPESADGSETAAVELFGGYTN